ncbi:MAG: transporter [Nevskia sp.]|nr:transporter [Nevskia sp.]
MESVSAMPSAMPDEDKEDARAARRAVRLGLGLKLGYASGALVDGVISNVVNTFLLFYVTTVCGMSAALAGAAAAVGLVVDAISDPVIGSMSDNTHSRWGRRLPFMVVAMPLLLVSFVMIFSLPDWTNQMALFALLSALSIAVRVSLSIFNMPYLAVGAELSDDYAERSRIMTWRWGLGMIGALIAVGLGFAVFFKGPGGLAQRHAYTPFALTLAVIVLAGAVCAMRTVLLTRGRQHLPPAIRSSLAQRLLPELLELFRNRSFRILFTSALLFFIAQGVTLSLGLHANTFFWRLASDQVQLITLAFPVGLIIGAPLSGPIVSRMEKRTAVLIGLCGLILMQAGPASLRLSGLLPLQGQTLALFLASATAIGGALMSMAAIAFTSMMADAADEHEHLFGSRREGLYFAGWAFAGKAATSIGTFLAGMVLQAIAFPVDQTKQNGLNIQLPEGTVDALGFFYGPGAALLSVLGVLILFRYRLDRSTHTAMMTELHQRRAVAFRSAATRP